MMKIFKACPELYHEFNSTASSWLTLAKSLKWTYPAGICVTFQTTQFTNRIWFIRSGETKWCKKMIVLDKMAKMINHLSQDQCNENSCFYFRYQADLMEIMENGTHQKMKLENNLSTSMYQTHFAVLQNTAYIQSHLIKPTQHIHSIHPSERNVWIRT